MAKIGDGDAKYTYSGKELDDTNLYYFGARYYDAEVGRFISEDPAKDGLNWYLYCLNNPLKLVDPTGYKSETYTRGEIEVTRDSKTYFDKDTGLKITSVTEAGYFKDEEAFNRTETYYFNAKGKLDHLSSTTTINDNPAGYQYACFLNRQDNLHSWVFDAGISLAIDKTERVGIGALYDLGKRLSWDGQPKYQQGDTIEYTRTYAQNWTEYGIWQERIKNDKLDRDKPNWGKITLINEISDSINNKIFGEKQ